jgi:hypothetical protein
MYSKLHTGLIISDVNYNSLSVRFYNVFFGNPSAAGSTDENWFTYVKWAFNYHHYLVCDKSEQYGDIHVVLPRLQYLILKVMMLVEESDLGSDIAPDVRIKTLFPSVNAKAAEPYAMDTQHCSITVNRALLYFNRTSGAAARRSLRHIAI